MHPEPTGKRAASTRTCVGCRAQDDAAATFRLVVADGEVAFDLAGGSFGRGAHVHPRPACLAQAPRGLARAFHAPLHVDAAGLGSRLVAACDRRMIGLLLAARRTKSLAIGARAASDALRERSALAVLATDAGTIASSPQVEAAVRAGRAMAWKTKRELGALLGEESVAICAVCQAGIADELKRLRAAADAGAAAMREGAGCSRRPEAR
jgi:predicted RNA-binding protein YlxR (DUF448 family)/ribosomal protein L7Ae-like RNA K-turn-binding protein